ncbi:4-hydroxy-tetrahydrodipicolinate reductase [Candidatus Woesearchaeota archaeon CG_4_10_14_0_2_um_filter_57_5]|nr:MAG: 4-hydroxy-tetrahydrodipicolinate reductase [Candidatus Woesearchaeota archaeon CG1_02_57_44]PIN67605.1 MAG: 4-hydroxy-tetrahydrodipicolinate reductase [Candidatus Woesearchaeota archaeon CG11_big_fil_rev_8_21_14_0_20_57_5]PIZ53678.1 MAG: 4-hydroxy-tetrahydrodipicolinate reductase [Candidatus Woesearchaeota archaeon CG_4_10_14_0_2_um_filter_57_5]
MRIAVIGYGVMGHIIADCARKRGHDVVATIDPVAADATHKDIASGVKDAEVCIDFTHPTAAVGNIKAVMAAGKRLVIGTTGWYGQLDEVKPLVKTALLYSPNFSIGVNIFFRMVSGAAQLFNPFPDYDVYSYELHHTRKADSPSGTGKRLGELLLAGLDRKDTLIFDKLDRPRKDNELHVASVRAGNIPGTHVVGFDSDVDSIEMVHTAKNREGFALGAVIAAEWILDKKGVFSIDDLMDDVLRGRMPSS